MSVDVKKTLVSIDLGNKQVKLESRITGVKVAPSVLLESRHAPKLYLGEQNKIVPSIYRLRLDKEEKMYHFGEAMTDWGSSYSGYWEDSMGFGMRRYSKPIFKKLFLFSIARVVKELGGHPVLDITTGLPTSDFNDEKIIDFLKRMLVGVHKIYVDDKQINFDVASINFYPQYLGSIVDNCYKWDGKDYSSLKQDLSKFNSIRYGFMDIGGGTILMDVVTGLSFNLAEGKITSKNGIHRLLGDIAKKAEVSQTEAEILLRNPNDKGQYILGEGSAMPNDITEIVKSAKDAYTDLIVREIEKNFFQIDLDDERSSLSLNKIFITGGGAYLINLPRLIKGIENSYNIPESFTHSDNFIEILDNSDTSNVQGYFKLGASEGLGEFGSL